MNLYIFFIYEYIMNYLPYEMVCEIYKFCDIKTKNILKYHNELLYKKHRERFLRDIIIMSLRFRLSIRAFKTSFNERLYRPSYNRAYLYREYVLKSHYDGIVPRSESIVHVLYAFVMGKEKFYSYIEEKMNESIYT